MAALRCPDFYGPGISASHLGVTGFGRVATGKSAILLAPPYTPHDFAYVPDIARAAVTLLDAPDDVFGQIWNMPCAPTRTPREILQLGADAVGRPLRVIALPLWLLPLLGLFTRFMAGGRGCGFHLGPSIRGRCQQIQTAFLVRCDAVRGRRSRDSPVVRRIIQPGATAARPRPGATIHIEEGRSIMNDPKNVALAEAWRQLWDGDFGQLDTIIADTFVAHAALLGGTGDDALQGPGGARPVDREHAYRDDRPELSH